MVKAPSRDSSVYCGKSGKTNSNNIWPLGGVEKQSSMLDYLRSGEMEFLVLQYHIMRRHEQNKYFLTLWYMVDK